MNKDKPFTQPIKKRGRPRNIDRIDTLIESDPDNPKLNELIYNHEIKTVKTLKKTTFNKIHWFIRNILLFPRFGRYVKR